MSHDGDAGGVAFLGLRFADCDLTAARHWVLDALDAPRFRYVVTPNVDHVVRLHRGDPAWREAFAAAERGADLCLNDSRILRKLARQSGLDLSLVPGSDLTRVLLEQGLPDGTKVMLVGGSAAEAAWLRARLPDADVTHFEPPMGVLRNPAAQQAIVDVIERERPQLTLFAIGAPQSEIVARQLQQRARTVGVALCIGASIEFLTGAKRRAPALMQRLGLEWAFRLASEPRRLWRRYLVEGPPIFAIWWHWQRARTTSAG